MTDRYGPYPIKGAVVLAGSEAGLAFPGGVVRYERVGDEDMGYGYDDVEKVAFVNRLWSSPEPWQRIADWYGRRLQGQGWEPLTGDEYRRPSGWPWDMPGDSYDFQRAQEEIGLVHYANPADLALMRVEPDLRAYADHTWFGVVIKAWSPGHERYPWLAEQLEQEHRHRLGSPAPRHTTPPDA